MTRDTIIALVCVVALAVVLPILTITAPLWAKEER